MKKKGNTKDKTRNRYGNPEFFSVVEASYHAPSMHDRAQRSVQMDSPLWRANLNSQDYSLTSGKMKGELTSLQTKIDILELKLQRHHEERPSGDVSAGALENPLTSIENRPYCGKLNVYEVRRNTCGNSTTKLMARYQNDIPKGAGLFSGKKESTKTVKSNYTTNPKAREKKGVAKGKKTGTVDELRKEVATWKDKFFALQDYCQKLKAEHKELSENYKASETLRKQQQQLITELKSMQRKKKKKTKNSNPSEKTKSRIGHSRTTTTLLSVKK